MAGSFWGVAVAPGKEAAYVPPPEESRLHLSQACLAPGAPAAARATVLLRVGDAPPLAVAALRAGGAEGAALDLVLDRYSEFSVAGDAEVHLTGYYMPTYDLDAGPGEDGDEGDEELGGEEESDEELDAEMEAELAAMAAGAPRGALARWNAARLANGGRAILGWDEAGDAVFEDEYDSGEDSDWESDGSEGSEGEEDESEEEEDSEEEDDSEEEGGALRGRPSVTIEEITEEEEPRGGKRKERPAAENGDASKKAKAAPAAAAKAEQVEARTALAASRNERRAAKKEAQRAAKADAAAPAPAGAPAVPTGSARVRRFANGFEIEDVAQGPAAGKLARPGARVVVRYAGRLASGRQFDASPKFAFRLGVGEVIKGWDRGLEGMRVGDRRRLTVPPAMGYGAARQGPIPPNSTLTFDVELLDVKA
jgi:FK506-binding nuclear protein